MQVSPEDPPRGWLLTRCTQTEPVAEWGKRRAQAQNRDTPRPQAKGLPTLGAVGPPNVRSWLYNFGNLYYTLIITLIITGLRTLGRHL